MPVPLPPTGVTVKGLEWALSSFPTGHVYTYNLPGLALSPCEIALCFVCDLLFLLGDPWKSIEMPMVSVLCLIAEVVCWKTRSSAPTPERRSSFPWCRGP